MKERSSDMPFFSLKWSEEALTVLDQTRIPFEEAYRRIDSVDGVISAISSMVIRGAPLIGIAGAFGLCLWAKEIQRAGLDGGSRAPEFQLVYRRILGSRPTAVNLRWALERMRIRFESAILNGENVYTSLVTEAEAIFEEDLLVNRRISEFGASIIPDGASIIHHCNTGSLATAGYGTALGAIRWAHESGKKIFVYLDETRPRFQGLALSAWELDKFRIPYSVIVDGASGFVMKEKGVTLALVGCDRVARNGDFANKIGTYNLAIVSKAHNVPFYVACPLSSVDWTLDCGNGIEIEERPPAEVTQFGGQSLGFTSAPVLNPAFDVTRSDLVTGYVTESGIVSKISELK